MARIYLIGFMGAGKTTLGKKLAHKLGYSFHDLDKIFEYKYKTSVDLFFGKYDEAAFRKIEHDLLLSTFTLENSVISTGGGTPCFHNNMNLINQNGISIYIKLSPEAIFNRLITAKKRRPLIANKSEEELMLFIKEKLREREAFYNMANYTISGISVKVDDIVEILRN